MGRWGEGGVAHLGNSPPLAISHKVMIWASRRWDHRSNNQGSFEASPPRYDRLLQFNLKKLYAVASALYQSILLCRVTE